MPRRRGGAQPAVEDLVVGPGQAHVDQPHAGSLQPLDRPHDVVHACRRVRARHVPHRGGAEQADAPQPSRSRQQLRHRGAVRYRRPRRTPGEVAAGDVDPAQPGRARIEPGVDDPDREPRRTAALGPAEQAVGIDPRPAARPAARLGGIGMVEPDASPPAPAPRARGSPGPGAPPAAGGRSAAPGRDPADRRAAPTGIPAPRLARPGGPPSAARRPAPRAPAGRRPSGRPARSPPAGRHRNATARRRTRIAGRQSQAGHRQRPELPPCCHASPARRCSPDWSADAAPRFKVRR